MREIFRIIKEQLCAGKDLVLVTVVASSGSTPRGAGSRMLIGENGRITGTIGGGAVEYRSEQLATAALKNRESLEREFSLSKDDVQKLGMICGGDVNVFFKFIPAMDEKMIILATRAELLYAAGKDIWLLNDIGNNGEISLYSPGEGFLGISEVPVWLTEKLSRHPARLRIEGRDIYTEQINSSGRVYIFGGGHVAQALVPALNYVGFRCVVLDDRREFTDIALFPNAEKTILCDFEKISDAVAITEEDYCCVMTRGHSYDTIVQAQLLRTNACYIGVIGSRSKKAGVFIRLVEEFNIPESELSRITSPIGISIKAETPAEIAVSITAQLIELRAIRSAQ